MMIMKEIYISANEDRSDIVSEIDVLDFQLHGDAPERSNFIKGNEDAPFEYDGDLSMQSPIEILIKT